MSNDRFDVLDRLAPLFEAPEPSFEAFLRRRDRKRRNQRISAGVVGIGVFVAAIWIVTSSLSFDRTETPAVPGSALTGPTESSDPGTGSLPKVPSRARQRRRRGLADGGDPSLALHPGLCGRAGDLVAADRVHRQFQNLVHDRLARATSHARGRRSGAVGCHTAGGLGRSVARTGERMGGPDTKPYVPSRYAICAAWTQETMRPPSTDQHLLRGQTDEQAVQIGEAYFSWLRGERGVACPEMTIEEARALDGSSSRLGSNEETAWGLYYDIKARMFRSGSSPPTGRRGQPVLPRVSAVRSIGLIEPLWGSDAQDGG